MKAARLSDLLPKDIMSWLEKRNILGFELDLAAFQVSWVPFHMHIAGETNLWGKTGFEIVGGLTNGGHKVFAFSLTSKGDSNGGLTGLIKTLMQVSVPCFVSCHVLTVRFVLSMSYVHTLSCVSYPYSSLGGS